MTEYCQYTAFDAETRLAKRIIVCKPVGSKMRDGDVSKRRLVPFAGFTGQQLAGSGALVFEGELLQDRKY